MNTPPSLPHRCAGMTLLELLLVVTILSAVAFMTLSQVTDNTGQVRYEDTRTRLTALLRGIVGHSDPVFNGQRLLSGYAADNGLIPNDAAPPGQSVETLIAEATRIDNTDTYDECGDGLATAACMDRYRALEPIFDPVPDAAGYNDGTGEGPLDEPGETLQKGWRGPYLPLSPGVTGVALTFSDGWGNTGAAPDHGWQVTNPGGGPAGIDLEIASLGRDGAPDSTEPPYDDDLKIVIDSTDWRVLTRDWPVVVTNRTGTPIAYAGTECLRLALLVYRNQITDGTNGRWRRLTSECLATPIADGDSAMAVFTENHYEGGTAPDYATLDTNVPQGEHPLLLIVDNDATTKHTTGGTQASYRCTLAGTGFPATSIGPCPPDSGRITRRVQLFAGTSLPNVEIVLDH
ncbi:MAG: prepilin-type N-terminal cleavage/methylation domain-containing protein [Gammaproteobacteria bacterium]|nr:prepilin-type N-terminal cleavage/methylation domain-containing protein [Gammaproteobacteria bacterium]